MIRWSVPSKITNVGEYSALTVEGCFKKQDRAQVSSLRLLSVQADSGLKME